MAESERMYVTYFVSAEVAPLGSGCWLGIWRAVGMKATGEEVARHLKYLVERCSGDVYDTSVLEGAVPNRWLSNVYGSPRSVVKGTMERNGVSD